MRYQKTQAFKKHLVSASPENLSRCYMVAIPDEYERMQALSTVIASFPGCPRVSFEGSSSLCREIADALLSPSLFGGEPLVVLENAEKMAKKEITALAEVLDTPSLYGYFVTSSSAKIAFMAIMEKRGVVLDLLDEKPWDREKRLVEVAIEKAASLGKKIALDLASFLLTRIGADAALLDSEMEKLACFIGERMIIEKSDVLCISQETAVASWEIAEKIIWTPGEVISLESSLFYGMISLLRSQLEIGLKLNQLSGAGMPREEWKSYLPRYLYGKKLEEKVLQALRLKAFYFQKGIDLLFEIEVLSRTGAPSEAALLDFFRISLEYARR